MIGIGNEGFGLPKTLDAEENKKLDLQIAKDKQEKEVKDEEENFKKGKEETEINEKKGFNVQCFLIDNMESIVARKVNDTQAETQYKTFVLIKGSPADICQEMLSRKGIGEFFNLTTAQKALLVPKIRLFKTVYEKGADKGGKDIELVFSDHSRATDIDMITKGKRGRGDDVGLKSFSYRLKAPAPEVGGLMECSMTLFFANASSFLMKRDNGVSFTDLIWDKKNNGATGEVFNQKNFRVKAVVGWNVPVDNAKLFSNNLKKALERTNTILSMTHVSHDLDFSEDGSLIVTINFAGSMDGIVNDPERANVFYKTKEGVEAEERKTKLSQKEKNKEGETKKEPKIDSQPEKVNVAVNDVKSLSEKEQERSHILELEQKDRQEKYSRVLKELYGNSKTYYVDVDSAMIREYTEEERKENKEAWKVTDSKGTHEMSDEEVEKTEKVVRESGRRLDKNKIKIYQVMDDFNKKRLEKMSQNVQNSVKEAHAGTLVQNEAGNHEVSVKDKTQSEKNKILVENLSVSSNSVSNKACKDCIRVYYFYLGDLLDVLFENYLLKREDVDSIKILIGDLVYKDPRTKEEMKCNIADLPVSLDRFMMWYAKKVIGSQTDIYTVGSFVKDVLNDIIMNSLGEQCFGGVGYNSPHIVFNTLSVPLDGNETLLTTKEGSRVDFERLKSKPGSDALKKSDIVSPPKLYTFLYIFASNYVLSRNLSGKKEEDIQKGVYHLSPGLDRGLVNHIKFKKQSLQYGAEAQLESKSRETIVSPNVYNATVEMVGNNLFQNGSFIYIDVMHMGMGSPLDLSDNFNLGGYYNITEVSFEFANDGDYRTTLEARWQSPRAKPSGKAGSFTVTNSEISAKQKATMQSNMSDGKTFDQWSGREQSIEFKPAGKK